MSDPTKIPWAWDWQHVAILGGYVFGAATAGIPLAEVLFAHSKDNPSLEAIGFSVLVLAAVGGWFKLRPNSVEEAIGDGKISVSQATQILSKRASMRPPPMDTAVAFVDPDKTKPV